MATVKFYQNTSDNRYLSKSLTQKGTDISCSFKEDTTQEDPVLIISPTSYQAEANYCYISDTGRYYYIVNVTFSQQRVFVHLRVDVLMSFGSSLASCKCIASRSQNKYNSYLNDDRYPSLQYSNPVLKKFPTGFNKGLSYVLTIAGGA